LYLTKKRGFMAAAQTNINTFAINNLAIDDIFRFSTRFSELVVEENAETLGIEKPFNALFVPALKKLDDAHKKPRGSLYPSKISDSIKSANNKIISIFNFVEIGLRSDDEEFNAAADNISHQIKQYRGVTAKRQNKRVAGITSMIQALEGVCADDVAKLGFSNLVNELSECNEQLAAYEKSKSAESVDKGRKNTLEARKGIVSAYRHVCNSLETLIAIDGISKYANFIENLNQLIKEFGGTSSDSSSDTNDNTTPPSGDNTNGTPSQEEELPEEETDEPIVEETHEEKMAKARPFTEINVGEWKNGDYCWHMVNSVKTYYKLLDATQKDTKPYFSGGEAVWEKL
jgi:hypothetical protein